MARFRCATGCSGARLRRTWRPVSGSGHAGRSGRWAIRIWPSILRSPTGPRFGGASMGMRTRCVPRCCGARRAAPFGPPRGEHPRSRRQPGLHRFRRGARGPCRVGVRGDGVLPGLADRRRRARGVPADARAPGSGCRTSAHRPLLRGLSLGAGPRHGARPGPRRRDIPGETQAHRPVDTGVRGA